MSSAGCVPLLLNGHIKVATRGAAVLPPSVCQAQVNKSISASPLAVCTFFQFPYAPWWRPRLFLSCIHLVSVPGPALYKDSLGHGWGLMGDTQGCQAQKQSYLFPWGHISWHLAARSIGQRPGRSGCSRWLCFPRWWNWVGSLHLPRVSWGGRGR